MKSLKEVNMKKVDNLLSSKEEVSKVRVALEEKTAEALTKIDNKERVKLKEEIKAILRLSSNEFNLFQDGEMSFGSLLDHILNELLDNFHINFYKR